MGILANLSVLGVWTTALSTTWTTSASTLKDGPTKENAISSILLSTTIASMNSCSDKTITSEIARNYIESLTKKEIVSALEMIDEKENEFIVSREPRDNDINVKVKKNNNQNYRKY